MSRSPSGSRFFTEGGDAERAGEPGAKGLTGSPAFPARPELFGCLVGRKFFRGVARANVGLLAILVIGSVFLPASAGKASSLATAKSSPGESAGLRQEKNPDIRRPLLVIDLFFRYDDDFLTSYDRDVLRKILPHLKSHPDIHVLLYAHADIRGTKTYNYALAESRGDSVKSYMVVRGIDASRIVVVPLGVDPIPHLSLCGESQESCYRRHRIVHLVEYIPPPKQSAAEPPKPAIPPIVRVANPPSAPSGISLLLPPGKLLVENTAMYIHNSASQVGVQSFTVNQLLPSTEINIQQLSQDFYIDILSFFLGVTSRLEMEADVPYVYRTMNAFVTPLSSGASGTPTEAAASGSGLGDVQFGLHYQFNTQTEFGGLFVGNLMVKSTSGSNPFSIPVDVNTGVLTAQPTGTGFWAFEPGVSVFFPTSSVVFYGNASYIYNMSRNFGGTTGTIDPGNATDLNLGGWFSFNPKASFTIGYDQMTVWPPSQNGTQIPLTRILQMGSVLFGTSYNVNPHFFYMVTVAAGVTPDAPNVQVMIRMPLFY